MAPHPWSLCPHFNQPAVRATESGNARIASAHAEEQPVREVMMEGLLYPLRREVSREGQEPDGNVSEDSPGRSIARWFSHRGETTGTEWSLAGLAAIVQGDRTLLPLVENAP